MALNWKYESAAGQSQRFWLEKKEGYYNEGLTAPIGAQCPYPRSSFAGRHWLRGAEEQRAKL